MIYIFVLFFDFLYLFLRTLKNDLKPPTGTSDEAGEGRTTSGVGEWEQTQKKGREIGWRRVAGGAVLRGAPSGQPKSRAA